MSLLLMCVCVQPLYSFFSFFLQCNNNTMACRSTDHRQGGETVNSNSQWQVFVLLCLKFVLNDKRSILVVNGKMTDLSPLLIICD